MKKTFIYLVSIIVLASCMQKYRTPADLVKLDKERSDLTNEITELNSKLTAAKNELPVYETKAKARQVSALNAATASSEQASRATPGDLRDMKKAKKKANKALDAANDANKANERIEDQQKKIEKLTEQIAKKQNRVQELDQTRNAIMANSKAAADTSKKAEAPAAIPVDTTTSHAVDTLKNTTDTTKNILDTTTMPVDTTHKM